MKTSTVDLDALLKRLHLANARRAWREMCSRAEKESWTYQHLLEVLFSEEVAHRQQTRLTRVTRDAEFPFLKTVDDFDFTFQTSLRLTALGTLLSPDFVTQGQNVVLHGKPGRGKTHLAIAIAYRAIQLGFDARFVTAAELIDDLSRAIAEGRMREALAGYTQPHVLVVDEVGYLAYGDDAANVLFHVVNERHLKKRSMVFTTNKALKQWGRVLHDDDLGDAIVDRILERGRVLKLDGPSVRSKHVDQADLEGETGLNQPAIVSGINPPPFPEPTVRAVTVVERSARPDTECAEMTHDHQLANVIRGTAGPKWMLFVDGENFAIQGRRFVEANQIELEPTGDCHLRDTFLWFPFVTGRQVFPGITPNTLAPSAIRAHYYTAVQGDDDALIVLRPL